MVMSRPPEGRAMPGDDLNNERTCRNCRFWRPHVHYIFIGYCGLHYRLTMEDYSCDSWEQIKIIDHEFYWCSTCKTRIMGIEAAIHLKEGHRVHKGAYIDPDVREELYSVF